MDECASNPCLNGGRCSNRLNSYVCTCIGGYSGTRCENAPQIGELNKPHETHQTEKRQLIYQHSYYSNEACILCTFFMYEKIFMWGENWTFAPIRFSYEYEHIIKITEEWNLQKRCGAQQGLNQLSKFFERHTNFLLCSKQLVYEVTEWSIRGCWT